MRSIPNAANIPILGIASTSRCSHPEKALRVGVKCAIVKPVKRMELLSAISESLKSGPAPSAAPAPPAVAGETDTLPPMRVLLVEDTRDNRVLFQAYLKRQPVELTMAENGQEGVDAFIAGAFDIVMMDIQMPLKDGYTATREIRAWERKNGRVPTPILALTAHAMKEDEIKSGEAGCDGHITKPIKKRQLFDALVKNYKRITAPA